MKVTGYKIQHAIRELTHASAISAKQFGEGLFQFEGENKLRPNVAMEQYRDAEHKIAKLQTAQGYYNLNVLVYVQGKELTLAEAVKLVGSAGRMEKMWRGCATHTGRGRYESVAHTRSRDEEVAMRTVSIPDAVLAAKTAARTASALREAIQVGNATEIDVPFLDPSAFE